VVFKKKRFAVTFAIIMLMILSVSQVSANTESKNYYNKDLKLYFTDISGVRHSAYFDLKYTIFFTPQYPTPEYPTMYLFSGSIITQAGITVTLNRVDSYDYYTVADIISELKLTEDFLLTINSTVYDVPIPDTTSNIYGDSAGNNVDPDKLLWGIYPSYAGGSFYVFGAGSNVFWTNTSSGTTEILYEVFYR